MHDADEAAWRFLLNLDWHFPLFSLSFLEVAPGWTLYIMSGWALSS